MTVDISDIEMIVARQNAWRQTQTINLIASENTPSAAVQRVQTSDFMGRYAEGHPNEGDKVNRYYQGTRYIDEIESMAEREIKELFGARQAGCAAATRSSLTRPTRAAISATGRSASSDDASRDAGNH
jgi:glycine hydroxymethyltransferase